MDVGHARKVFVDGFLRDRDGYKMELPLVPLGELYGTRLERWLADNGVEVRLTTGVRSVDLDVEGAVSGLTLRSGERRPGRLRRCWPSRSTGSTGCCPTGPAGGSPGWRGSGEFDASPITGVHLWFDREVCPVDHVVTVGRLVQWVFNHTALQGRRAGEGKGQYLQVVISASYDLVALDNAAIRDRVLADLASIWPASREATLERWRVVTEHGATFAVRPGVDAIRPRQRTEVDGLYLAGDWTDTGWPATMEGRGPRRLQGGRGGARRPRPARGPHPARPAGRLALAPAARAADMGCPGAKEIRGRRGRSSSRSNRRKAHARRIGPRARYARLPIAAVNTACADAPPPTPVILRPEIPADLVDVARREHPDAEEGGLARHAGGRGGGS